jgi:hypothetical protein
MARRKSRLELWLSALTVGKFRRWYKRQSPSKLRRLERYWWFRKLVETVIIPPRVEPPPAVASMLELEVTSYSIDEGDTGTFEVLRYDGFEQTVTVDWTITSLSGFVTPLTGTVRFNPGEGHKSVALTASAVSANELGTITLSNPAVIGEGVTPLLIHRDSDIGATLNITAALTIVGDVLLLDSVIQLSTTQYVGNENTILTIPFTRGGETDAVVSVDYNIVGVSVSPTSGTVQFALGQTTRNIDFALSLVTANEVGTMTLSNPQLLSGNASGAVLGTPLSAQVSNMDVVVPPPPGDFEYPLEHFTQVSVNPGPASLTIPEGKAMLVIGMSNTTQFTQPLIGISGASKTQVVDGATGGAAAAQWANPSLTVTDSPWVHASDEVSQAGFSANDVHVVWVCAVNRYQSSQGQTLEEYKTQLEEDLRDIVLNIRNYYPQADVICMSGLHNEHYAPVSSKQPEPPAWWSSTIADDIINDNADMYWGPYLWNPIGGRSGDGFEVTEDMMNPNDVHLTTAGSAYVADSILVWLQTDEVGRSIFYVDDVDPPPPPPPGDVIDPAILRSAGYVVVDDYSGVDSSDNPSSNSTAGIQNAIDDSRTQNKPLWFAQNGIYYVTDTLRFGAWDYNSEYYNVMGGGQGGGRPLIRLKDGSSGFGSSGTPRPVITFRLFNVGGTMNPDAVQDVWPSDPMSDIGVGKSQANVLFWSKFHNVDIDCGNNAGAFGMYFPAAQRAFAANVKITATNALGGWMGVLGRSAPLTNVEVIGGVWQLKGSNLNLDGNAGICIAGCKLIGDARTTEPFHYGGDSSPTVIVGFDWTMTRSGTFVETSNGNATAANAVVLIDGIIRSAGGRVIDNSAGRCMYIRNVYITGTEDIIQSGSEQAITATGTWKLIEEYSYSMQGTFATGQSTAEYYQKSIIDGSIVSGGSVNEPATSILSNVAAPTEDYIATHTEPLQKIDDGPFEDIRDHGAQSGPERSATGMFNNNNDFNTADARTAIHAAFTAAAAAGHDRVLVPRGGFYTGEPGLNMLPDTKFIGVGDMYSKIGPHGTWATTTSDDPWIVTSADDALGTAHYSGIGVTNPTKKPEGSSGGATQPWAGDNYNFVWWRTGRFSSSIQATCHWEYLGKDFACQAKTYHRFSGNAGGKHYGFTAMQGRSFGNVDCLGLDIYGTSEPLLFYGVNVEFAKAGAPDARHGVRIKNSSNIRVFGTKREGHATCLDVEDCSNIAYHGWGRVLNPRVSPDLQNIKIYGNSDDILLTVCLQDAPNEALSDTTSMLIEDLDSSPLVKIQYPVGVALYKRGTTDDAAMKIVGGGQSNAAPVASSVSASGTAAVGATLTGSYVYSDSEGDAESGTTFRWLRSGAAISGETGQTYVVAALDAGRTIKFEVTPRAVTGTLVGNAVSGPGTTIPGTGNQRITAITFDISSIVTVAPGNLASAPESDNYPVTWGADNHQYTSYGDGEGFATGVRASIGWARIEGNLNNFSCFDTFASGKSAGGDNGKCQGMLAANGRVYTWWDAKDTSGNTGGSQNSAYDSSTWLVSTDGAQSWTQVARWDGNDWGSGFNINDLDGWFGPSPVQFGQDHAKPTTAGSAAATDGYTYHLINLHEDDVYEVQTPGGICMMRCLVANLDSGDKNDWEYYIGSGWTSNINTWINTADSSRCIFQDATWGSHIATCSYNVVLDRYILTTFHRSRTPLTGPGSFIGIYDAPEPWGPYEEVLNQDVLAVGGGGFATGESVIMWNFSNKWLSEDGLDVVMIGTLPWKDEFGVIKAKLTYE